MLGIETVTIKNNKILLRPLEKEDADLLFKITSDPGLMMYYGGILSMEKTKEFLQGMLSSSKGKGGSWAIFERSKMKFAGYLSLTYDPQNNFAEIQTVILPEFQRKGIARQVMELSRSIGRKQHIDIAAFLSTENKAAKKLVRSVGMKFKKYAFRKGKSFEVYAFQ